MSLHKTTGVPVYFNDLRQLDTENMIWTRPRIAGTVPTARYMHSASRLQSGNLCVYGGWGKGGCQSNDLIKDSKAFTIHILDTKTMTWSLPRKLGRKETKHLYSHSVCNASDSTIFLYGGFDGRQALRDFYVVNFEFQQLDY